jgi:hypothetical protein
LANGLGFSWDTTTSLLFLSAPDHRILSQDLDEMRQAFAGLNTETSRSVLRTYQSRKLAVAADSDERRLPQLYSE